MECSALLALIVLNPVKWMVGETQKMFLLYSTILSKPASFHFITVFQMASFSRACKSLVSGLWPNNDKNLPFIFTFQNNDKISLVVARKKSSDSPTRGTEALPPSRPRAPSTNHQVWPLTQFYQRPLIGVDIVLLAATSS